MMTSEVEMLRQQVQELAGRLAADSTLLRQALLSSSTPQLRATHVLVEKLGEESHARLHLRNAAPGTLKAFEEQRKLWVQVLDQELASREAQSPQV